jgi:hypothetical protein
MRRIHELFHFKIIMWTYKVLFREVIHVYIMLRNKIIINLPGVPGVPGRPGWPLDKIHWRN